jgi:hypothetical protein
MGRGPKEPTCFERLKSQKCMEEKYSKKSLFLAKYPY